MKTQKLHLCMGAHQPANPRSLIRVCVRPSICSEVSTDSYMLYGQLGRISMCVHEMAGGSESSSGENAKLKIVFCPDSIRCVACN